MYSYFPCFVIPRVHFQGFPKFSFSIATANKVGRSEKFSNMNDSTVSGVTNVLFFWQLTVSSSDNLVRRGKKDWLSTRGHMSFAAFLASYL